MTTIKSTIPREGRTVLLPNGKEYTFSDENTIEVEEGDVEELTSNPEYNLGLVKGSEKTDPPKQDGAEGGLSVTSTPPTHEEVKKQLVSKKVDELREILKNMEVDEKEYKELRKDELVELILVKGGLTEAPKEEK